MSKLIIISGPTATGKTSLAIEIAKKFNGELISSDSRQIYRGLDIGTGKDHPKDIKIHLINIIDPNQSFSVAQYRQAALTVIADIESRGKLPIIVGGTGQYIDSIANPKETFVVKPNNFLRFFLNRLSLKKIQTICRLIDPAGFSSLNNSDLHNPRRLIRRIEVKLSQKNISSILSGRAHVVFDSLHLSLTAPNDFLYSRIDKRVEERLQNGLLEEISYLLQKYSWHHPGLNTLAYKEFKKCFTGPNLVATPNNLHEQVQLWKYDEHSYARRQKTWFKKMKNIQFIDITHSDYRQQVEDKVQAFVR